MLPFLYYCLKVIVCSGILYGYYLLALRNNRFHQWNRWYLLATVGVSFTLPLLQIPLPYFSDDSTTLVYGVQILAAPDFYFAARQPHPFRLTVASTVTITYSLVCLCMLFFFFRNLRFIQLLKQRYRDETANGIHFYSTAEPGTPFSFFKNIFWNTGISLRTEKGQQMLRHEMAHVTEWHSADKVSLQILTAFAFWNPFLYLIKKELSVVHEFIADQKASAGNDKLQYASLLLMKAMGSEQYALGNPFFHSQLKRRLIMLTTNKNPRFSYVRRLLVLPLAAISIILFSFKYKEVKDKQKVTLQTNTPVTGEEDFYGDTTKPKLYVQLNKTYKGSAIESIMPTTDMSGAVIKTVDDKTYFLDRAAAAKEFNFIITDSGFIAPPGAVLVTGTSKVVARNGAFIQMPPYNVFLQYPYTVDTTAYGLLKAVNSYSKQGQDLRINQNQDIRINNGSINIQTNGNTDGFDKALIIVDGVKVDLSRLKILDVKSFKSMDVLKGETAIAQYGQEGKNGVFLITTKAKEPFPNNVLYVLDGVESTKEIVEHILPDNMESIDVLKGEAATKAYGEKGKNGVVKITTKLAKNEVTFPEANPDNRLAEKVVIGHKLNDKQAVKEVMGYKVNDPQAVKEVMGYRFVKDSTVKGGGYAMVKQPDDLKEVVVVGYGQKNYEKVFTKVDKPASFPGGLDGWRRYLERQLQYPKAAQEKGTQGTVQVQMIVAEDGNISELKALNDPGNGLAEEAVRVIAKGPKWIPATQNGHPVTYRFVQNLTFQLQ